MASTPNSQTLGLIAERAHIMSEMAKVAQVAGWFEPNGDITGLHIATMREQAHQLAELLGFDLVERPKPLKPHQTNTEPSRRYFSAADLADIAYDERRDALEAAE
ncbi:hypothetical protein [Aureimonas sp. N4]|uniref:hypothetical protein n=1 Tax=Aureimonas sp. N4 TaxID=1638165 RepID=UPI000782295E|nr:hypothetical protein [Aureimonas sp. N4]